MTSLDKKWSATLVQDAAGRKAAHVAPVDDSRAHNQSGRGSCWCQPRIDIVRGGYVVTHNAADGRDPAGWNQ